MDTRTFYGRIEHEVAVRAIPSDSKDSAVDSESDEEWTPDNALEQNENEIQEMTPETGLRNI